MVWDVYRTIRINKPPQTLWRILMDVSNWPVWDVDLAVATLDSPPSSPSASSLEGSTGSLQMKFNQTFRFTLHDLKENQYVAYKTSLPGADADWYWQITPSSESASAAAGGEPNAVDLRMGVKFNGWATFAYRLLLGARTEKAFEICTQNLKELCETGKVTPQP